MFNVKVIVASKEASLEIHLDKMLASLFAQSSTTNIHLVSFTMKYVGVLRDTARAPKPTTQYNTKQYHAITFIR